ncbi:MAG: hypothetical protein WD382_07740 [Halofilum sp. (in: g-proteobacteria)]
MHRRNLINALLLIFVMALASIAWLGPASNEGSVRARLSPLKPSEVSTLEIEYASKAVDGADRIDTLALERRDDGWHLRRPLDRPARDGRIATALGTLGTLSDACYTVAGRDPADFGLDTPRLRLRADDTEFAFGDRSADGRRYVQAGRRMCLLPDQAYPLLAQGLDGLASPALLPQETELLRIETPWARAARRDAASRWSPRADDLTRDVENWAARWLAAQAHAFILTPPAFDHGDIRIEATDGRIHEWRIARMPPDLVLVPAGANYGVRIAEGRGEALLRPVVPGAETPRTGAE